MPIVAIRNHIRIDFCKKELEIVLTIKYIWQTLSFTHIKNATIILFGLDDLN